MMARGVGGRVRVVFRAGCKAESRSGKGEEEGAFHLCSVKRVMDGLWTDVNAGLLDRRCRERRRFDVLVRVELPACVWRVDIGICGDRQLAFGACA